MNSSSDQIVWKRSKQTRKEMEEETHHHHQQHQHHHRKKKTKTATSYQLISYTQLPDYMKDNEYILDYYRAEWPLKLAFYSLFRWHNETLNVWTHLIGFLVFMWFTISNFIPLDILSTFITSFSIAPSMNYTNSRTTKDFVVAYMDSTYVETNLSVESSLAMRWPFFVFLAGSMFCLLTSSTCHLFCCHSHRLNLLLLRFDYSGIAVMIITSFFPPIYYLFQCNPLWQFIYLAGITTMGALTVTTLLAPSLSTKHFRKYRAMLFFSMGFSGIVPAIHALIVFRNEPRRFVALAYESTMALSYAIGTLFYVTRVPERWMPGWFDLVGHSHQIFHVFVIMGALAHYGAALLFIDWRDTVGCM